MELAGKDLQAEIDAIVKSWSFRPRFHIRYDCKVWYCNCLWMNNFKDHTKQTVSNDILSAMWLCVNEVNKIVNSS